MTRSLNYRPSAWLALLLSMLAAAVAPADAGEASSAVALEVGQPFPPIVLPSMADGTPTSLAQFRGKKLLLHIFASW